MRVAGEVYEKYCSDSRTMFKVQSWSPERNPFETDVERRP